MNFIVIEGDNGTGKDTLAQGLEPYGFNVLTYHQEAQAALAKARNAVKEGSLGDSIASFLIMERTPYEWITIPTIGVSRLQIIQNTLDAVSNQINACSVKGRKNTA